MADCCCSTEETSTDCCCSTEEASTDCCCSDEGYSCKDDAYAGRMRTVVVDFLFIDLEVCDRCQGADERVFHAVERCRPILASCGYNLVLNQVLIEDEAAAERWRFYSSPTIRVNGIDICPSVEENDCGCCSDIADTDVKCRVFPLNGGSYEVPPTDMIVGAIMRTALREESADPTAEPYECPANLRDFFEGKQKKQEGSCCCC